MSDYVNWELVVKRDIDDYTCYAMKYSNGGLNYTEIQKMPIIKLMNLCKKIGDLVIKENEVKDK